ncbi:protein HEXIM2-like [Centruroides sculpturatus]|uniref:protein HEXIM2-like n=1 Tax=Centruroides sculpturatus TaxID=218467 RepID=UPI000C6E1278|nr:protein HEXIM2-like [Centruroides sculpturatus]
MDIEDSTKNIDVSVLPSGDQNTNKSEQLKSKKDRHKKKRKWKPYHKMSWKEKRKADKNETKRANRVREKMFANGQAIAPYNTTQFLMADHNQEEPNYFEDDDVLNDTPSECLRNEGYMQKQFAEAYENVHTERLNGLSKSDLVQEYLLLEDKVEELEKKCRQAKEDHKDQIMENDAQTECLEEKNDDYWQKVVVFREEIEKLKRENNRLRTENEELTDAIYDNTISD